ncbi:MAG TPA: (2Fe-2S)-binding protein [Armatimonadetes bacterium]|nr:(2Fe-2S)-binding protein [Armatimonadota bacterium]
MPKIRFEREGKEIEVGQGANLRRTALMHGVKLYRGIHRCPLGNCHGLGLCGSCWVEILEGTGSISPPSKIEQACPGKILTRPPAQARLACQVRVYGDIVVRTQS